LKSLTSPSGHTATFDYFNNLGDQRLKEIWHKDSAGGTLSKFDYQYDVLGQIIQWAQQSGTAAPLVEGLEYDAEHQLLNAGLFPAGQAGIKGYSYVYDAAGNRTSEQIDTVSPNNVSTVTMSSYNNLNQLTGRSGGAPLPVRFEGTVNEAATVTFNGQAASVSPDPNNPPGGQLFSTTLSLQLGGQDVPIAARDFGAGTGNTTTHNYFLTVAGGPGRNNVFYDYNGNITSFTTRGAVTNYQWDAENRLVAVSSPVSRTEFTYDAFGRRVKIVEKTGSGTITSTKQFVWAGGSICEERDANNNVTKRFFPEGQINYTSTAHTELFYTRDHLGSVRGVTDKTGLLRARYDYDPYGRRSPNQVVGANAVDADFGFTGHYFHAPSGLHLARFRAYDSDSGRWLNRDPIGERGGLNLYGYVANSPIGLVDPLGLEAGYTYNPDGSMTAPRLCWKRTPPGVLMDNFNNAFKHYKQNEPNWWDQTLENFRFSNEAIPGTFAPPLMGSLTGGSTAASVDAMSLGQWITGSFPGSASGLATFTSLETGAIAASVAAANYVLVAGAWEGGLLVGSALAAAGQQLFPQ
jgi:RHS repeat-associated protein